MYVAAMCLGQQAYVCEYIRVLVSETVERYATSRLTQPTDRIRRAICVPVCVYVINQ